MVRAIGTGLALTILMVALSPYLPLPWLIAVLIVMVCVNLAIVSPEEADPTDWLPQEENEHDHGYLRDDPKAVCGVCGALGCYYHESLDRWDVEDERAFTADCEYDEERE